MFQEAVDLAAGMDIPSIECTLHLEEIYEKVDLEAGTSEITRDIPSND